MLVKLQPCFFSDKTNLNSANNILFRELQKNAMFIRPENSQFCETLVFHPLLYIF